MALKALSLTDTTANVDSVTAADTSLTISPNTGAVLASLNVNNANAWTGKQTLAAGAPALGTTTNDNAATGYIGEYISNVAPNTTSTVTITIASPGVITWTAHGLTANIPVTFSTTISLPTGLTAGTTYYIVGASITANTFQVATTIANAILGTAVNTSGSQSGVQTGVSSVNLANNTAAAVTAIQLTAGDWDVYGTIQFVSAGSAIATAWITSISQSVALAAGYSPAYSELHTATQTGQQLTLPAGSGIREPLSGTTTIYLIAQSAFSVAAQVAAGTIWARRRR